MTSAVHFIMQGKGGVGKSVVARLLQEYMIAAERDYVGFDADPVNQTFAAHGSDRIKTVDLLDGNRIVPQRFDEMIEEISEHEGKAIIIDTGASSFLPFMDYIDKTGNIELLQEEGFEVFIHTVVTGGTSAKDTVYGFLELSKRFGESCNIIVWENSYFDPVRVDGKSFTEMEDVAKAFADERVSALMELDKEYELVEEDLKRFLEQGESFAQASDKGNKTFNLATRKRLRDLGNKYFQMLDPVIGVKSDDA